jgi:hypothetical protein
MSEIERRWTRDDGDQFRLIDGRMERCWNGRWGTTGFTLDHILDPAEFSYTETFDHLPPPDNRDAIIAAHEAFYRDFRQARATEGRYETERLLANAETALLRELRRIMGDE